MRRSVLTAAVATALLGSQQVHALGLGEAEVESFLNQPLKVRIPIIVENEGERESLRVDLAAAEDFRKVGLDRAALGLNLDVELMDDDGQLSVLLSSQSAVTDPFLQVLLNADWSSGRLLRQYTLFLDPPLIEKPTIQVRNDPPPAPASNSRPAPARPTTSSRPNNRGNVRPASRPSIEGQYGPVGAGETLWSIASRSNPDTNEYTVNQVMLAYVRMNPDAFDGGNVNSMRRGASLQVPGSQDIAVVNAQEALRLVQQQHRDWRGDFGSSQSASSNSSSSSSNRDRNRDGRLQLVPPEESSAPITNSAGMRAELARLEEELLTAKLENRDLVDQVENLREEIARLEGDGLQDRELAQFQNYLGEEQSSEGDETYVDPFVNNGFDSSADANNPADSVSGDPLAGDDALTGGVDANGNPMDAEPMVAMDEIDAGDAADNTNAQPIGANTIAQDNTPPTVAIDQPPVAAQPAQSDGDNRIFSPLTLAIAAIGGLGVVFLLLMQRRRDRGGSDESPAKARFSAKDFLDKAKKLKEKKPKKEKKEKVKSKKKSGAASLADRLIAAGKQQKAEDLDAPLAGAAAAAAAATVAADGMAQEPEAQNEAPPPDDTPISTLADSGLNDPSPEELSAMHGHSADEAAAVTGDAAGATAPPPEPKEEEIDKGLDFILDEPEPEPQPAEQGQASADGMDSEAEELLRRLADDDDLGDLGDLVDAEESTADAEKESGLDFDLSGMEHLISGSSAEESLDAAADDEEDPYAAVLRGMAADDELERSADLAADPLTANPAASSSAEDDLDDDSFAGPDEDEVEIKLDLARAYISMGDNEAASTILDEILAEGNDSQRAEARNLLKQV